MCVKVCYIVALTNTSKKALILCDAEGSMVHFWNVELLWTVGWGWVETFEQVPWWGGCAPKLSASTNSKATADGKLARPAFSSSHHISVGRWDAVWRCHKNPQNDSFTRHSKAVYDGNIDIGLQLGIFHFHKHQKEATPTFKNTWNPMFFFFFLISEFRHTFLLSTAPRLSRPCSEPAAALW